MWPPDVKGLQITRLVAIHLPENGGFAHKLSFPLLAGLCLPYYLGQTFLDWVYMVINELEYFRLGRHKVSRNGGYIDVGILPTFVLNSLKWG